MIEEYLPLLLFGGALALGYFTNLKFYLIGLSMAAVNLALNWSSFMVAVEPPWWASLPVIGWLYAPVQTLNYVGVIWSFAMVVAVASIFAYVAGKARGRKSAEVSL